MPNDKVNPMKRFSNRVDDYIKSRPSYPEAIITFMQNELGLIPEDKIADIGSGTGKLSELLLKNPNMVYCVEPNKEMREAAEKMLKGFPNFISINGTAENTGLEPKCIRFITCAQAFHWFNHEKAKSEFERILLSDGWVVLIWNSRVIDSSNFMKDYEKFLLEFSVDYSQVNHKNIGEKILNNFFSNYRNIIFPYSQIFDFKGLRSRLLSSSYIPSETNARYSVMMDGLKDLFEKYEIDGNVEFIYNTEIYFGRM